MRSGVVGDGVVITHGVVGVVGAVGGGEGTDREFWLRQAARLATTRLLSAKCPIAHMNEAARCTAGFDPRILCGGRPEAIDSLLSIIAEAAPLIGSR
jgi:hypothetical protein